MLSGIRKGLRCDNNTSSSSRGTVDQLYLLITAAAAEEFNYFAQESTLKNYSLQKLVPVFDALVLG